MGGSGEDAGVKEARSGKARGEGRLVGGGVGWGTVGSGGMGVGLLIGLGGEGTGVGAALVVSAGGVGVAGRVLGCRAASLPQAVIKNAARSNAPPAAR